jgi:hypothetical protein
MATEERGYKGRGGIERYTIPPAPPSHKDCNVDCKAHDDERATRPALTASMTLPRKGRIANVMVSGSVTTASGIRELNSLRSDPMMRDSNDERLSSRNGSIDPSFPTPLGTVALRSGQKVQILPPPGVRGCALWVLTRHDGAPRLRGTAAA